MFRLRFHKLFALDVALLIALMMISCLYAT
jgi:hypothetical protein